MRALTVHGKLDLRRMTQPPPTEADTPKPPSALAGRLALAHYVERLVQEGVLRDYSDAARRFGVTAARMTQIINLLTLSPRVQKAILTGELTAFERQLRAAQTPLWAEQRQHLNELGAG